MSETVVSVPEAIRRRRMTRSYAARPVPAELVDELVGLGVQAPSAGFTQGVSFLVLSRAAEIARFWAVSSGGTGSSPEGESRWLKGMRTAPVLILVWSSQRAYELRYAEPDKGWPLEDQPWSAPYWYVDAGMGIENILLGAVAHGLGAGFFGVPPDRAEAVRREFGVPDDQLSIGVVSLGWPASEAIGGAGGAGGSPSRRPRRPIHELVHRGAW